MKVRNQWNEIYDILKTVMPIENYASVRKKRIIQEIKGKVQPRKDAQSLAVGILWEYAPDVPREEGDQRTCRTSENSEGPMFTAIHFSLCRHSSSGTIICQAHSRCGVVEGLLMGTWPPLQVPGLRSEHQLRSGTWKNGHDLSNCPLQGEKNLMGLM